MKRCSHILYSILVPLVMVGLVSIIAYFAGGVTFTSNDCYEQYLPFFGAYHDVLTEGKSIFYSLSGAMGYDFFAMFAYYLASPLNLIVLLFPKEYIIYVVNALIIIKVALAGGGFAAFIKGRFPKSKSGKIVLFSTIYAISGYTIGYMWNVMWLDSLALFPLVIMGLDMLMRNKKPNWYIYTLCLSLTIICCYMMGYMICIFIFLYFFTYKFDGIKDFFIKLLRIGFSSILAVCLSAIIIIPAYEAIQSSIVSTEVMPKWEFYGSFVNSFKTLLIGYPPHGVSFVQEHANLFITVFGLLMTAVYFVAGKIKVQDKIKNAVLLLIMIIGFNLKPVNYLWHGMHEQNGIPNRFSFMVIFVLLTMGFSVSSLTRKDSSKRTLFIGWGILSTLLTIMAILDNSIIVNVILTVFLALAYVLMLGFLKGKNRLNTIRVIALLEILITLCIGLFCSTGVVSGDYGKYVKDFDNINATKESGFYREKIDSVVNDKEFYYENEMCYMSFEDFNFSTIREFMDVTKNMGHASIINEGTYYGINSMGMFYSFHHYNLSELYNKTGGAGGPNNSVYYGDNVFMDMILGVKYYYVTSTKCNTPSYTYIRNQGDVEIYENKYALSVGFVVPETFLNAELTYNPFTSMNNMSRSITGEECFYHNSFIYLGTDEKGVSSYGYKVLVNGELLIQPDNGLIEKIVISVDDEVRYTGSCPEVIVSAGEVTKGQDVVVEAWYSKDYYTDPTTTMIYSATFKNLPFERLYKKLSKEQMTVVEYSEDYLVGEIELSKPSKVLVTIPNAKGYTITVDGKEAEYELYQNIFYVFDMTEGKHEIVFRYETPGFRKGLMISGSAFLIYIVSVIVTVVVQKKRQH